MRLAATEDPSALIPDLRRSSMFKDAPEDWLSVVARRSIRREHHAGHHLWLEGEPAAYFSVIVSGLVELHREAPDGEDAILGLFGPGDTVGVPAILERGRYPVSAVASSRTVESIAVEAQPLLERMATDARLANATHVVLLEHIRALRTKIGILSCANLSRGLATLLLDLAIRFGHQERGRLLIPIALSRGRIARILGAREETVIRLLSGWRKMGWISDSPNGLEIANRAALEHVLVS